jgi:pilus assembly protein CpaD
MVNNPLDLLYPRAMTPADASRRSRVLDLYRSGASTTSANSLIGGSIAGVGQ